MDNTQPVFHQPASSTVNVIVLSVVFLIGLFLVMLRADRYLKIKAIDDCARISKYEKTIADDNSKVTYPLADVYQTCLKDKGIK